MADYKQLCAELLDWTKLLIEIPDPPVTRCADDLTDLLARTRAALAEFEAKRPTVMEIIELADEIEEAGLGQVDLVRAALARWGTPNLAEIRSSLGDAPKPPTDGEVAELVEALRGIAYWRRHSRAGESAPAPFDIRQADRLDRAASLLEQQYLQPTPVSERVPDNRDPECVANWPDCWSGGYDPRCCRFPKSCSCERSAVPPRPE